MNPAIMGVYRFEDLEVWKLARQFCDEIGGLIRRPAVQQDRAIRDGLNETAVSIVENIAEGFERESRKEFAQFVRIAKGSNGEARALLYLARGRGYLTEAESDRLLEMTASIRRMLRALHRSLTGSRSDST